MSATPRGRARRSTATTRTNGVEVGEASAGSEEGTRGTGMWASLACRCDRLMRDNRTTNNKRGSGEEPEVMGGVWHQMLRSELRSACLSLLQILGITVFSLTFRKVSVCGCALAWLWKRKGDRKTAIRTTMPSLQENRMTSGFIKSNNPAHTHKGRGRTCIHCKVLFCNTLQMMKITWHDVWVAYPTTHIRDWHREDVKKAMPYLSCSRNGKLVHFSCSMSLFPPWMP